jgi:aminoglycoside phosphotransferase
MNLPSQISELIRFDSASEVHIGESKSRVFRVLGKLGEAYFLKIANSSYVSEEIEREVDVISWLSAQRISVPSTVALVRKDARAYFLMTAIPGHSMAESAVELDSKDCLRIGAEFLRKLHSLEVEACPFDRQLNVTRKLALANLENGLVDESDLDIENRGKSLSQLALELDRDFEEDLVFTHGDYCFPNIICQDRRISGRCPQRS